MSPTAARGSAHFHSDDPVPDAEKPPEGGCSWVGREVATFASRVSPSEKEMTLPSRSQGRGYPITESRVAARNRGIAALTCDNASRHGAAATRAIPAAPACWSPSLFDDCPLCGKSPIEPVRVEGQLACRGCTGACVVCGAACIPGDDACGECARCVRMQMVPA